MRLVLLPFAVAAAALAVPALAAERTVTADGFTWSPPTLEVSVGDTVTWTAPSGTHDLSFSDGVPGRTSAGSGWSVPRRFDAEGSVRFRCSVHSGSFTDGMSGVVTVKAASPYAQTPVAPGVTPGPSPVATRAPSVIQSLRVRVKARVATAIIRVSHATRLTGTLARRPLTGSGSYRSLGAIRPAELLAGKNVFAVRRRTGPRRLARGRYRVRMVTSADQISSTFRVK